MRWLLALLIMILATPAARAHAFLDHAEPSVGGSLSGSPASIKLWFTEEIEPKFSKAELMAVSGGAVQAGPATVDISDHTELVLPIPHPLGPGTYKVTWRVVSVDTHVTEGGFTFEVRP